MPKRRKQRRSRRKLPWPLGEPIERLPFEGGDDRARRDQYHRMLKLKECYRIEGDQGAEPWYQLALAIASDFDEGLRIVEMKRPSGKTAPKWRGAEGLRLLYEVAALLEEDPSRSERWCLGDIKKEIPHRYTNISLDELVKRFAEAKRHHLLRSGDANLDILRDRLNVEA